MGGSIHIHGTGSSIVDTVFVCRDLAGGSAIWAARQRQQDRRGQENYP
jgi:hypothetical protein